MDIYHPCDLTLDAFDETAASLAQGSKSTYSLGQQTSALKWILDALEGGALLDLPFDWDPPASNTKNTRNRIKPEKSGRPLTSREIEAVAFAFRNAQTVQRHCS